MEPRQVEHSADTHCYAAFRHLLGERVKTVDGIGILIGVKTPYNGVYCRPEQMELTVWYPQETRQYLTSWTYRPEDISEA